MQGEAVKRFGEGDADGGGDRVITAAINWRYAGDDGGDDVVHVTGLVDQQLLGQTASDGKEELAVRTDDQALDEGNVVAVCRQVGHYLQRGHVHHG